MKKVLTIGLIILPVLAVGCRKESDREIENITNRYELSCDGTISKIALGDAKNGEYTAVWEDRDEISVYSSDGSTFEGNASLSDGAGNNTGKFTLISTAAPGTKVRAIYPVMDGYGNGILPNRQSFNSQKPSSIHYLTCAYSDEFELSNSSEASFTLHHAMAIVKIKYSCSGLPQDGTLRKIVLRSPDNPVTGSFKIDYSSGTVTPGTTLDYVELQFTNAAPAISGTENYVMMAVLPDTAKERWCIDLEFDCAGKSYSIPAMFKAQMKGGEVNVIDLTGLDLSSAFTPFTIFVAGDSTAAIYGSSTWQKDNIRGWAQMLHYFYNSPFINVDDRAVGGRSSKTFRTEGNWDALLGSLKAGDLVIIQFGHNDENTDKSETGRGTTPQQYYNNMVQFVLDVRAKNAEPILATSILRRRFHNGEATDDYGGNWSHKLYTPKVKSIADSLDVKLIDALEESRVWLNSLGAENAKNYYHWFNAGDYPAGSYPDGNNDDTHLNQKGAYEIALRIAHRLNELHPEFNPESFFVPYSVIEKEMGPIKVYCPGAADGSAGDQEENDMELVTD